MPLAAFPKCFLDRLCVLRDMSVTEWIDLASELDIDGLEFYGGFIPFGQSDELVRLREFAEARGLAVPMTCVSPDFTQPDPADRAAEVERQRRAIEATATLGGAFCRVLTGQRRPNVDAQRAMGWVVECIRASAEYAASCGVTLVLENHYKDGYWVWPEFAQRRDVFLEVLTRLEGMPSLAVNFDPSNALVAGEDPIEMLEAVKHRVVTMHASDRTLEGGTLEDLWRQEAVPQVGGMLPS